MEHSVLEISRPVRRRLKRLTQKSSEHGRRAHAILLLWETSNYVAEVARRLYAARSSVQRWRALYEEFGEDGLIPIERGRNDWKACDEVLAALGSIGGVLPRGPRLSAQPLELGASRDGVAASNRRGGACHHRSPVAEALGFRVPPGTSDTLHP